jgi:thimet oligopeptidase
MRFTSFVVAAGLAAVASAGLAASPLPGPAFPQFTEPKQVDAACDQGLGAATAGVKALERRRVDAGWIAASDDLNAAIEDVYGPIAFVSNVHPDKAIRDAAQACELRWQGFLSSLGQNERLYQATRQAKGRDEIDRQYLRLSLEGFEDAGMSLPAAQRPHAKELIDRINEMGLQFSKNIRDSNVQVPFTEAELKGVPDSVWKTAKRDDSGRILLGLDNPSYVPVVQSADSGVARERMWRARMDQGGAANIALLDQIAQARREYAKLFGFDSYADFMLRRRMVQSLKQANAFLTDVKSAVIDSEKRELTELRAAKAAHLGQPVEATRVERWDVNFYNERVKRERYSVDQDAFRPYFPPQASLEFVMKLAEKLFGVRYTRVDAKTWHPEVQAYAVSDIKTGKPLAALYVDLYPREGKYNHAAVWPLRSGAARIGRVPQGALVVNFDRQGLTLDELETLLHEFGHAIHGNLSTTRYTAQSGTSTVFDFAEAPSQMLEDWVYDKHVLMLMREVCASCKPVPDELLAQAIRARDYGKGVYWSRQHLQAAYDLALYGAQPQEPLALWASMEGATPLSHVAGSRFPAGFEHIATHYGAGYYGYLWSLVVAMDLRTPFAADKLDPAVGLRYRNTVLANGGQRPAQDLVREFLGRDSNSKAFFDDLRK